jgi:hypothetical protein
MLEFTSTFRTRTSPKPALKDEPARFTILLTGAFAGEADTPFAQPLTADVDSFDRLMEQTKPAVTVAGEQLVFRKVADFEPLMLAQAHSGPRRWLEWLSAVRAGGPGCAAASEATAAMRAEAPQAAADGGEPAGGEPGGDHSSFDELLSGSSKVSPEPTRMPARSIVDKLIARSIEGTTAQAPGDADALLNAIAEKLGEALRGIYHDPAFRALETAWLAIDELVGDFDSDDPVRFLLLPYGAQDWPALLADGEEAQKLRTRLVETCPARPDVIVTTETASPAPEQAAALHGLAALSSAFGCPVIANAALRDLLQAAPGGPVTRADLLEQSPFPALATPAGGAAVRLATPRFRVRLPYGEAGHPVGAFAFEEWLPGDPPEYLPWGPASLLCARAWAEKYREEEEAINWNEATQVAGFPPLASGSSSLPATERFLTDTAMAQLYRLGCLPVTAMRNSDRILIGA